MRIALLDARQGDRDPANSSTVAYRNMLQLSQEFGADLYVSARQLAIARDDYDVIVCGFGSTSTERHKSVEFLNRNKSARLYWLVGEYEQSTFAPLFYSKRPFHVLRNYDFPMRNKLADAQTFVNLNALIARPNKAQNKAAKYGAVYYGRWREDRAVYFKRYLQRGVMLSTSSKNMKVFAHAGCAPSYARAMSWDCGKETLRLFASSLYIEDVFTHTHYNCPANRYYESLFCGVPLLFQPESIGTFGRYGIDVPDDLIVRTSDELVSKSRDIAQGAGCAAIAKGCINDWHDKALHERAGVIDTLREIFERRS